MTAADLHGHRVLVTRPRHQSKPLINAIEASGGEAIEFPLLEILPRPAADIKSELTTHKDPDMLIFVSANAVACGLTLLTDHLRVTNSTITTAAIGPTTAAALREAGVAVDVVPEDTFDSQRLLNTPELHAVEGKTITIVRGESGRELLADTLRSRGATVQYLTVYRREPRVIEPTEAAALAASWKEDGFSAVVIMSQATCDALFCALPPGSEDLLSHSLLVAPSARVLKTALDIKPQLRTAVAAGPTPNAIVTALKANLPHDPDTPL